MINNLKWRYSTKVFDKTKKVSQEDLNEIIETFRLSPSSLWLQPWKLICVDNDEIRKNLKTHSWDQPQITDSSHLFVLTIKTNLDNSFVDNYLETVSNKTGKTKEELKWYEDMMKWFITNLDENEKKLWANQQVFIALWNMVNTLAQKHVDSCIIWGFNSEKYDEILWLKKENLSSVVVLSVWYRDSSDEYAKRPKIRFSKEEIYKVIR